MLEGVHPRFITEGYELAKNKSLEFLSSFKNQKTQIDTPLLQKVAQSSLGTKVQSQWTNVLVPIVTEAVQIVQ
jgi:T-complex protein 1 subunit zeta